MHSLKAAYPEQLHHVFENEVKSFPNLNEAIKTTPVMIWQRRKD